MASGSIKRLDREQGIGYIREAGGDEDIFFHATSLIEVTFDRLQEGQSVQFDRKAFPNAPGKSRATKVRVVQL